LIVVVRHGETDWSEAGRHTGRTDVPLNDRGRRQAAALQPCLAGFTFAAVLVSPLQRAQETAARAGLVADPTVVHTDPDLVEWDYGDIEGRTTDELRADDPTWNVFDRGCPGGETIDHVAERADRAIARASAIDGDVAIVSHAHLLRVLGMRWIGAPPLEARHLRLDPAAWCELGHEREWPAIVRWNRIAG
jgi:broad specificity phosphatase PhoE